MTKRGADPRDLSMAHAHRAAGVDDRAHMSLSVRRQIGDAADFFSGDAQVRSVRLATATTPRFRVRPLGGFRCGFEVRPNRGTFSAADYPLERPCKLQPPDP
jgi:hypothetical protein